MKLSERFGEDMGEQSITGFDLIRLFLGFIGLRLVFNCDSIRDT